MGWVSIAAEIASLAIKYGPTAIELAHELLGHAVVDYHRTGSTSALEDLLARIRGLHPEPPKAA